MLEKFVANDSSSRYITTYTRNPSVLRMVRGASESVFPLTDDDELRSIALEMDNAALHDDNIVYHFDRYDEGGLFGGDDPADRSLNDSPESLKQRFNGLESTRNALVIAAKLPGGKS